MNPEISKIEQQAVQIVHKLSLKHWLYIIGSIIVTIVIISIAAWLIGGNALKGIRDEFKANIDATVKQYEAKIETANAERDAAKAALEASQEAQARRRVTVTQVQQRETAQIQQQRQSLSDATPKYLLEKMVSTIGADPASMRDTGQGIEVSYQDAKAFVELGLDYKQAQSDLKATAELYDSCKIDKDALNAYIVTLNKNVEDIKAAADQQVAQVKADAKVANDNYNTALKAEKKKNSFFGSITRTLKTVALTAPIFFILGVVAF